MKEVPQTISKQWIRLREILEVEIEYSKIAQIMISEGYRTQRGKSINKLWVIREINRGRKQGFFPAVYRSHRFGGPKGPKYTRKSVFLSLDEVIGAILRADIRTDEKVRLVTLFAGHRYDHEFMASDMGDGLEVVRKPSE